MPSFSEKSLEHLNTCDYRLQQIFTAVIADGNDCTVIEGHRTKESQDEYFRTGKSKMQWPNGKHCSMPSLAADVMPCPINWNDRIAIEAFSKVVLAKAESLGIRIRWGGDWNQNGKSDDEKFFDGPHYELVNG